MATLGDGGFKVTPRMHRLTSTTGYLDSDHGGQELRDIYAAQSAGFDPTRLNPFAFSCFFGTLEEVVQAVETGTAPPLDGTETPFKFGYATLVIAGSQRLQKAPAGSGLHSATLEYLLTHGCPVDTEDICRYTALDHATMAPTSLAAPVRTLLEHGAQPNHQNIYGMTPIAGAIMGGDVASVDLLMEFGADLAIPDADGTKFSDIYVSGGPQITAVIRKWLRTREGATAPRETKACAACGKTTGPLKQCAACHSILYCSAACQRSHWRTHKPVCQPFSSANTVTVRPMYIDNATLMPTASLTRALSGYQTERPAGREHRAASQPESYPKSVVIKIQVPPGGSMPFLVYNKKRDFVCHISRAHNPNAYDRVASVVREKGAGNERGAKGYFAAELKSPDELVVKVSELLADQPF